MADFHAIRLLDKSHQTNFDAGTKRNLSAFQKQIDDATKFIPLWVKVAVAIALGLGTMVGWKRIVVTVGERIGKTHLTYAQGASAEVVAMLTIGAADMYGLPVSTTGIVIRRGRRHGRQPLGFADGDDSQFVDGLGAHLAGRDAAIGLAVLVVYAFVLRSHS